jgi:hypothetical protein
LGVIALSLSPSGCLFRFINFLLDDFSHLPSLPPSVPVGDAVEEDEGEVSIAALQDPRYASPHQTPLPHPTPHLQHKHSQLPPLTRTHHSLLTLAHTQDLLLVALGSNELQESGRDCGDDLGLLPPEVQDVLQTLR